MHKLVKLWSSFAGYKVDPDLLNAYRTAIPSTINLRIEQKANHYIAVIQSIEKEKMPKDTFLVTEADSDTQIVDMVNDLILSYKNIPELYRPYFKRILMPEGSKKEGFAKELTLVKA